MGRTFQFLGLLASAMSLVSLIYGAFQEALFPYLQGVAGGMLDGYRLLRDGFFSGIGFVFSALISWLARWFSWLPPLPWFVFDAWVKDSLTLYLLVGASFSNDPAVFQNRKRLAYFFFWPLRLFEVASTKRRKFFRTRPGVATEEVESEHYHFGGDPRVGYNSRRSKIVELIRNFVFVVLGAFAFFLIAYAENRIGL